MGPCGNSPGSRAVDVGYRRPEEMKELAEMVGSSGAVYGVEPSESKVSDALKDLSGHPNIRMFAGSTDSIPLSDGSVNFALLEDVSKALGEAGRVCKENGRVVVFDFARVSD